MAWQRVLHPKTGKLMFRYDGERGLAEVSDGGNVATVDLTTLARGCKNVNEAITPETVYAQEPQTVTAG